MDELTKKNFLAMSEGLKALRTEVSELKKTLVTQNEQIQQLKSELESIKQSNNILLAKHRGTGPTA